jgi:hypothetical protein
MKLSFNSLASKAEATSTAAKPTSPATEAVAKEQKLDGTRTLPWRHQALDAFGQKVDPTPAGAMILHPIFVPYQDRPNLFHGTVLDDIMIGGPKGDHFFPGLGQDVMGFGSGNDTVYFQYWMDSTANRPDGILSFDPIHDKIDVAHFLELHGPTLKYDVQVQPIPIWDDGDYFKIRVLIADQQSFGYPPGQSLTIDLFITNTPQLQALLAQPIPADPAHGILESDPSIIRYLKANDANWLIT